ncbi:MAG TPA: outer membrane protein transport protein [Gammaproteobacteria bacterium]|nr:outer membrane protein transport protein [Gammaproteobacteria bacterium]
MANTPTVARQLLTCSAAGLLTLASAGALASSFALIEQSVNGMGSAYAIGSAGIDDASTVFYNPAGMSRLSGSHLNGGLQIVYSQVDFKGSGQYNPNNLALGPAGPLSPPVAGNPISGKTNPDTDLLAGIPSGYVTHQYSDRVWFGLGLNAPFGLKTDYDNDWVGRYNAIKSELYTYNINPSLAFKFTDHATIGVGLSALYADGKLTNAEDLGLLQALGGSPVAVPGAFDGRTTLTGNDWGYGYNFGLLLEPTENTRFGFHYRSKIELTLDGDAKVRAPGFYSKQDAKLDVTLPDSLSVSAYHAFNSKWAMMADFTWTQWSRVDSLDVKLANGSQRDNVWEYEDSSRYAIGAEYRHDQAWTLRTGVALDQTPVPNNNLRSPRVPDEDRIWLSFGATYRYSPDITFDFGYAHLFVDDPKLDNVSDANDPTLPFPAGLTGFHTVSGDYDASVDIFGVAVNWKFK